MSQQSVTLVGGLFDGDTVRVDPARQLLVLQWEEEKLEHGWDPGVVRYVTEVTPVSYRRVDERTFEFCRTPGGIGDDPTHDHNLKELP